MSGIWFGARTMALSALPVMMFLWASPACSRYILVVKSAVGVAKPRITPEVTPTARYRQLSRGVKIVAYRPPDSCNQQSAGRVSGRAHDNQFVLATACGVWMAELERAFVRAGYHVVSWDSLKKGGTGSGIDIAAAKQRGVQVIFMINSLSAGSIRAQQRLQSHVGYYESDSNGAYVGKTRVPPEIVRGLQRFIPRDEVLMRPQSQLSASIDITAVDLTTNQSIWFYRQTYSRRGTWKYRWRKPYCCTPDGECEPLLRRREARRARPAVQQRGEVARSGGPMDITQAQRYQLIKHVVRSLVGHFSGKRARQVRRMTGGPAR